MEILFIRHGETKLNKQRRNQYPDTPLSEKGKRMMEKLVPFLKEERVEHIVSSDYVRALESARIIGDALLLTPEENSLFREIRRPKSIRGNSYWHPKTLWYLLWTVLRKGNKDWRYQDGENFLEVGARAQRALASLEPLAERHKKIVVVTHRGFLSIMLVSMCTNGHLSFFNLLKGFFHITKIKNAEVVRVRYTKTDTKNICQWSNVTKKG